MSYFFGSSAYMYAGVGKYDNMMHTDHIPYMGIELNDMIFNVLYAV